MTKPGHQRVLLPLGPVRQGVPTKEGWSVTCKCGWEAEIAPVKRIAILAYKEHLAAAPPICKRCGVDNTTAELPAGSRHLCGSCRYKATQEWAKANPTAWDLHKRRSHLKRRYGITEDQYQAILDSQAGVCAICQGASDVDPRGFRPHIDHCHDSGRVRGILCGPCNIGIGNLGDDPVILRRALAYLLRFKEVNL